MKTKKPLTASHFACILGLFLTTAALPGFAQEVTIWDQTPQWHSLKQLPHSVKGAREFVTYEKTSQPFQINIKPSIHPPATYSQVFSIF